MTKKYELCLLLSWSHWTERGIVAAVLAACGWTVYWRYQRHVRVQRERAARFLEQLVDQQEAERMRMARIVHDRIGSELAMMKNAALQGILESTGADPLRQRFSDISRLASEALEEARTMAYRLRPFELECLGLDEALHLLLDRISEMPGIRIFHDLEDVGGDVSACTRLFLYRVTQGGLHHLMHNCGSSTILIEIKRQDDWIRIRIEGSGSRSAIGTRSAPETSGFDLDIMETRTQLVGGTFHCSSSPGKLTVLRILLPVSAVNRQNLRETF